MQWRRLQTVVLAGSFSIYGSNYAYRCGNCGRAMDGTRHKAHLDAGRYDVYGRSCDVEAEFVPITEDAIPNPLETYGVSKYMQELCFRGFPKAPVHVLRFSSVYGDRLRLDDGEATIIARLAGWIRAGERPRLFEDGRQIRDWVYVGDIVDAVLAILEGKNAPPVVNVCSGVPTRLIEACDAIASAVGTARTPEIMGGYRLGDMRHCLGDPSTLRQLIGREPVRFRDGAALAFGLTGNPTCAEFSSLTV
jgi:dTDP-L-rhamnose 4-epimerase